MAYSVVLSPPAVRAYRKLDASTRSAVEKAIDALAAQPLFGPKIKRLKGQLHDYYRYRSGDYRIVYTVSPAERRVYVDYLQHRKDVYRHLT